MGLLSLSAEVREHVYSYLRGVELSVLRVACVTVSGDEIDAAARCSFKRRFEWVWPHGERFGSWPKAMAALESRRAGCFMMVGGTRGDSEPHGGASYVKIFESGRLGEVGVLPSPRVHRNAVAAVRDAHGDLVLAGGWDGQAPLRSVERFDGWAWTDAPHMNRPRCFAAAGRWRDRVLVIGGANTLWVLSSVTAETELLEADSWRAGPTLLAARCGHGAATTLDGEIVVAGGYGGGPKYFRSCELLGHNDTWTSLPAMTHVRTGAPVAYGPDNAVYVVGGSPDGSDALATCERLDTRSKTWTLMPPMSTARSYLAAAFDAKGDLVAQGGYDRNGTTLASAETFDVRKHLWRPIHEPLAFLQHPHQGQDVFPDLAVPGNAIQVSTLARAQNAFLFALLEPHTAGGALRERHHRFGDGAATPGRDDDVDPNHAAITG